MKLAIIGDFNPANGTHIATDDALAHSANLLSISPEIRWVPTETILDDFDNIAAYYDSFLISPGSPYRDMNAVLEIIRYARTNNKPVLGTCGGFQHMAIEFARNVLHIDDAEHAETSPYASRLIVSPLTCNLKGDPLEITITDEDSQTWRIYNSRKIAERYYCNFGLNPEYQEDLNKAGFRIVASDATNEARILELRGHRFFIATLFVPQTGSTAQAPHKLITAFLSA